MQRESTKRRFGRGMPTTFSMIKSATDREKEAKSSYSLTNCLTSREIFLIYKAWFANLLLILGIKSLTPYQRSTFQEIRDLGTEKLADKYLFCIFSAFVCLSITNFSYVVG